MSGLEAGAAVFSLVVGAIEIIHRAIEIYEAVNDKSGIPKTLKKVSEKLPSVEEILKSAETQRRTGALKNIDKDTWANAEREVEKCKQACQELHDLLQSAYPKADSGRSERLWKGAKTVLSGKGKTAEVLLKEISVYLTFLAQRKIVNNAALLEDIKSLVEELCHEGTTTYMHNINGDNIGTLHGDKNVNSGSGFQFTGSGGTYNFGGAHSEETQYALLSSRHRDHKSFSDENSRILRNWISRSYGQAQSLTVSNSSGLRFEKIYRRISDDDPIATYRQFSVRKAANTTGWLVDHEGFKSWLFGDCHHLWLSGKVGSGKSTLVTTVIDQCRATREPLEPPALLMFFFQGHKDTTLFFFESLLKQLIAALVGMDIPCSAEILSALEDAYGNDVSRPEILQVFHDLVIPLCRLLRRAYLVIDGIDKCRAAEVTLFWKWLVKLSQSLNLKVLVTSADQAYIVPYLNGFSRIRIDRQHNQADIDTYIDEQVASKSSPGQVFWAKSFQEEVKGQLQQKADGMFLWIHLVLKIILDHCETPAEVRKALKELPPDLEAVYALCLEKRRDPSRPINAKLFTWVCAAPKPLSVDALRELLAMDPETGLMDMDDIPFVEELLNSGAGLVVLATDAAPIADSDERPITPVHSTVRSFVFSERFRIMSQKGIDQELWPLCLQSKQWNECTFQSALGSFCLAHIKQRTSRELRKRSGPTRVSLHPPTIPWFIPKFLAGARSGPAEVTVDLSSIGRYRSKVLPEEFLRYAIENWLICNRDLLSGSAWFPWATPDNAKSGLEPAAALFEEIAIERNDSYGIHPWDAVGGTTNSHLWHMFAYAVAHNHVPLMQVVKRNCGGLPKGVFDSPLAQHDQMLALHVAVKMGFAAMIDELIGVCNLDMICPSTGWHVLHYIARTGHVACLQPFLKTDINWDFRDRMGCNALIVAAMAGHRDVLEVLLETKHFEVDGIDATSRTSLFWAARFGHNDAVKLLLEAGAAIDPADDFDSTPLSVAVAWGHGEVALLLLETGKIDVNTCMRTGSTPLTSAAANGFEKVVQQLVKLGKADVDVPDIRGRTPLSRAAYFGHDEVVKLLLENGAETNKKDEDGRSALWWAAYNGHHEATQLLLDTGKVDCNAESLVGKSPLLMASAAGRHKVVQVLLGSNDIDINAQNKYAETPLRAAVQSGHAEIVKLLLRTGKAEISATDRSGQGLLHKAVSSYREDIVQLLLDTGQFDVNLADKDGRTPLTIAGHLIAKLLLETGRVDVNAADAHGWTPLARAAFSGDFLIVKLLLETKEVDLRVTEDESRNPWSLAVERGHFLVVQLLEEAMKRRGIALTAEQKLWQKRRRWR